MFLNVTILHLLLPIKPVKINPFNITKYILPIINTVNSECPAIRVRPG